VSPELAEAVATARAFQERANALRVVLILEPATMIDVALGEDIEITEGDQLTTIPAEAQLPAPPRPLPEIRPTPSSAIAIDVQTGELSAPLGSIEHLAGAVLGLASAFGGRTVASAEFTTSDPALPITFAAREGERVVLGAGDAEFEL
jgi:hypothetical protein